MNERDRGQFFPDRLVVAASVLVASGALLVGCTSEAPVNPPVAATETAGPTAIDAYQAYDDLPEGPCHKPTVSDPAVAQADAKSCVAAYGDATIALVNFGVDSATAQKLETDMATTITHATNGLVHPQIELVTASSKAQDQIKQSMAKNPGDCIDTTDATSYASAVAAETMPELKNEDFIVSLDGDAEQPCQKLVSGVADQSHGRDAEVFVAATQAAESTAIADLPTDIPGVTVPTANPAVMATHEFLHLLQLGHDGSIYGGPLVSKTDLFGNNILGSPSVFDLKAYLDTGDYNDYGSTASPMGNVVNVQPTNAVLNTVQLNELHSPEQTLGESPSLGTAMTPGGTTFTESDAQAGKYAELPLNPPYAFTDKQNQDGSTLSALNGVHQFNEINVVPKTDPTQPGVVGADIMISDPFNNTADLGVIGYVDPGQTKSWTVAYADEKFKITLNGKTLSTELLSAS